MPTVLVIDDNPAVASALEVLLSLYEIDCVSAASPQQGLARLDAGDIDLVIQDMNFSADTTSGEEGVMLFGAVREQQPDLPVILLTAWTHLESAVELVRAGAADYLAKPWDDHKLMATVSNLLELSQTQRDLQQRRSSERRQQRAIASQYDLCGMVYADTATERVVTMACQVARAPVPVLIRGANGSGKECIARIVQANSSVRDGPFVTVNCGALPSELIEAELFGADAGAYTGANKAREGKFEAADGGTLFLDEIGNLPLAGQMKLLRVLETGRFERLGSNRERQVQVRVISASNADIGAMIRTGQFREDLYYRLNLIELKLPPLHERPADIVPLAIHFLEAGKQLAPSALNALQRYPWPGNVRELKNVIQRACLLAGATTIEARDLGLPSAAVAAINTDSEPDRVAIEAALGRAGGNVSQAAAELGLSRQALYRRMERLGLSRG
ncbi:MAG: sigma-54 dependent transcriptional regulator [Xanthomonadaceae bacterium]|nr:sigma-54 dependent transcriptional regulator [Xanthomonadaceae bacterium]MDP2184787.1 sigma-54 dependent transcriptional regulator [Xanthomonadales bacterium]MDZ4116011.1 sigma-54 dependent transcriptional regulator [Xanthomonadaceae bacterium]